jgi:predicted ATPase
MVWLRKIAKTNGPIMTASSDELSSGNDEGLPTSENGLHTAADPRLFHSITLRNLLSFAPDNEPLELKPLNVLIGPNGSGKSNLLEAIGLLRATASDIRPVLSRGGGVAEWIWKGNPNEAAVIDVTHSPSIGTDSIRHVFAFRSEDQSYRLDDEFIELPSDPRNNGTAKHLYLFNVGRPFITAGRGEDPTRPTVPINPNSFKSNLSVLAQRDDPENYPEISRLKDAYDQIRLYREWQVGRDATLRNPQRTDLRTDRLEEDLSNLSLFLNRLRRKPKAKQAIYSQLCDLYEGLTDFDVSIEGGTVHIIFAEGNFIIPAARLSDGSLRYLCLLAILCDSDPPPLIGIEEPELGLHPDLLPKLADLLVEASARCQLIVTTHSDILVDALSEQPESIIVCEKHAGSTSMKRLNAQELAPWLEKYRLGQLWTSGHLGGTRW